MQCDLKTDKQGAQQSPLHFWHLCLLPPTVHTLCAADVYGRGRCAARSGATAADHSPELERSRSGVRSAWATRRCPPLHVSFMHPFLFLICVCLRSLHVSIGQNLTLPCVASPSVTSSTGVISGPAVVMIQTI